jgi:prophage regulatory protein
MKQTPEILSIPNARIRPPLVQMLMGWSRATLYRRIDAGEFPKPIKDGPRCVYWPAKVVADALSSSK